MSPQTTPEKPGVNHNDAIRQEFEKQATHFNDPVFTHQLAWMIEALAPQYDDIVLDVAAGTGHIGRALAAKTRYVIATDLTPEMLRHGKAEAEADGLHNILFEVGDAAHLPYLDASFNLVTARFAIHHFEHPELQLAEMRRVCRPGGRIGIIDTVTLHDPVSAQEYNRLQRLRDHTHTRAFSPEELGTLLEQFGMRVATQKTQDIDLLVDAWLKSAQTAPVQCEQVKSALYAELDGGPSTGMRPFLHNDDLWFRHTWAVIIGQRP